MNVFRLLLGLLLLSLAACAGQPISAPTPPVVSVTPPVTPPPANTAVTAQFQVANFSDLPEWGSVDLLGSWQALLQSCKVLQKRDEWRDLCVQAKLLSEPDSNQIRTFIEHHFQVYQLTQSDGHDSGLVTGYYEPRLKGAREASSAFPYAVYGVPDDLITVDLSGVYPDLKNMRLRGRLDGKKLVPYYSRGELEAANYAPLQGKSIAWVADPVDLLFLHIQGSGRIELPDGKLMRVGYADQNGYPYKPVGRWLLDQHELKPEQMSLQNIKTWAHAHPERLPQMLAADPSFVFFRELPASDEGPYGALNVPLTDSYSIAVDARVLPLGAPVFLSTTWPASSQPLNRLMLAQDTGGAIHGIIRADFFWGFGPEAGELAGKMRQSGKMWLLWPAAYPLPKL